MKNVHSNVGNDGVVIWKEPEEMGNDQEGNITGLGTTD